MSQESPVFDGCAQNFLRVSFGMTVLPDLEQVDASVARVYCIGVTAVFAQTDVQGVSPTPAVLLRRVTCILRACT